MDNKPTNDVFSNIGEALSWAMRTLKECGIADHEQEAEFLLTSLLDVKRHKLYMDSRKTLTQGEASGFKEYVKRRCKREPAQYITGTAEFRGLVFEVTPATLIPRPETELLVEEGIKAASPLTKKSKKPVILDLCTGSGCIAVTIASELPGSSVYATDISPEALSVAGKNALANGVADRIRFLEGDLFKPLYGLCLEGKIDMILSNPPYIPDGDIEALEPEVKDHEPLAALRGGKDGLDFYRRIIAQAPVFLSPEGNLILELGWNEAQSVTGLAKDSGRFGDISTRKDYAGIERVFMARKK